MNLNNFSRLCALLCCVYTAKAQYTETINSNRPGTSQGAFAVGNDVLQLETGFGLGWDKHKLSETESDLFIVDYSLRYGLFFEQLELNFSGSFVSENGIITQTTIPYEYKQSNFRSNTLGVKYLVYDPYRKRDVEKPNLYSWHANNSFRWRELIPAVSVFVGVNIDNRDNPYIPSNNPGNPYIPPTESSFSPKAIISTQNNLEGGWVFVTNFIADRIGQEFPSYSYILTLTHAFTPRISAFVENQGIKSDFYADQILRFGGAFLVNKDFQVDALSAVNFKDTPSKFFVGIGASYRFDMHSKDLYIEEGGKRAGSKEREERRRSDFMTDDNPNEDENEE